MGLITLEKMKESDRLFRHSVEVRDTVREKYPTTDAKELANSLGMSYEVLKSLAKRLGVRKRKN